MGCYIAKIRPPSEKEYKAWQEIGFFGGYEDYVSLKTKNAPESGESGHYFVCGDLGQHCSDCSWVGEFLCDYPVGDNKTCDRVICEDHAREVAPNIHYCEVHYKLWAEFRDKGGVDASLKNVIAFKCEK